MLTYEAYGLHIGADVELPLRRTERRDRHDIVFIREADRPTPGPLDSSSPNVVAAYGHEHDPWYVAVTDGSGFRMRFRDTGEFRISGDLRTVRWSSHGGDRSGLLPILIAGTVLSFVLTLADELVLHASAVAVDGRVVAFVGQSGRGKSTMAALVASAGAPVVTDDVLVVDTHDQFLCHGNGGELRLRPAAEDVTELFDGPTGQRRTFDERLALDAGGGELRPRPLAAIVVPQPRRDVAELSIERVPSSMALLWLTTVPRVYGLRSQDTVRAQFEHLGRLTAAVPVFRAEVPWGPPFSADIGPAFLALVRSLPESADAVG